MPAETYRIATFNTELQRQGPGLLLRDIARSEDPQIAAVAQAIADIRPDVIALQGIDFDLGGRGLKALAEAIRTAGHDLPHVFAARPNTGMQTGLDLDGDGRTGGPRDAQGYGQFSGQAGMAVLSRHPILEDDVKDFSALRWRDLPGALRVTEDGLPFPSAEAEYIQRLSSVAHWDVPIALPEGPPLHILTFHATPPVFDGPEDRNGKRNHDEILFWTHYLDGVFGDAPSAGFVLAGDANNDPDAGEGLKPAIRALIADPRLQDPRPRSDGSLAASGDPFDTVDWDDPEPGNLRVSYVLPSTDWRVVASGVHWPEPGSERAAVAEAASRHRIVWVDITR